MAPEEYAEVKERYDFLQGQLQDLKTAREDLRKVTQEIRTESAELFVSAYNKIKKNFHTMFRRLFGGGRAELRLTDQENVLESGIDISPSRRERVSRTSRCSREASAPSRR